MGKRKQEPSQWDSKVLFIIQAVRNMEDQAAIRAVILDQLNAVYRQGLKDGLTESQELK